MVCFIIYVFLTPWYPPPSGRHAMRWLYVVGRDSWVWDMSHALARLTSSHGVGEESMAVVCRRCRCIFGSSLPVMVVVEYIITLIIIIVEPLDFGELHFCQTVQLESLLFFKPLILPRKVMSRQIELLFFFHFSYALEGRIWFLSSKIQLPEG